MTFTIHPIPSGYHDKIAQHNSNWPAIPPPQHTNSSSALQLANPPHPKPHLLHLRPTRPERRLTPTYRPPSPHLCRWRRKEGRTAQHWGMWRMRQCWKLRVFESDVAIRLGSVRKLRIPPPPAPKAIWLQTSRTESHGDAVDNCDGHGG